MQTIVLFFLFFLVFVFRKAGGDPNYDSYPVNSLIHPDRLFPIVGTIPQARVHSSLVVVGNWIISWGGYRIDGLLYDDIQLFDTRSRIWSGNVSRVVCCNEQGLPFEIMGDTMPLNFPYVKPGFQGDVPLARAEHGAVGLDNQMWIYGGLTQTHGLVNDLWSFEPGALKWTDYDFVKGPIPSRRAGHAMAVDTSSDTFYTFGGRSVLGGSLRAMNDVWMFNTTSSTWTYVSANSGDGPAGRQAAAMTYLSGYLFIYGGYDPVSNVTFSDLWAFHTIFRTWQMLVSTTGRDAGGIGRYPPPLHSATLIPLPANNTQTSMRPASNGNTTINSDPSLKDDGLLLYGGLGSGGACAAGTTPATNTTHHPANTCDPLITDVGQIYRINIASGTYHSPRLLKGNTGGGIESQYISGVTWEFARLTSSDGSHSAPGAPSTATEVLRTKSYALESVAYDPLRNILYEFGGLQATSVNLLSTNYQSTFDYSAVQTAANAGMDPIQQQYTALTTDSAPLLKAGGQIPRMAAPNLQSDTTTGSSGFHTTEELPTNGPWQYQQAFAVFQPPSYNTDVRFLRSFRTFVVTPSEMVLVVEDALPSPTIGSSA